MRECLLSVDLHVVNISPKYVHGIYQEHIHDYDLMVSLIDIHVTSCSLIEYQR